MDLLKKIEIKFKPLEDEYSPQLEDCYLIISTRENTYFCRTVSCIGGSLHWSFNRQSVRVNRTERNLKLKVMGYQSCKTLTELQLEPRPSAASNNTIGHFYELKNGQISVYLQYCPQQQWLLKHPPFDENLEKMIKKTKKIKLKDNHLLNRQLQKASSWKLIPYKQREYWNLRYFHSPKKVAETDVEICRQPKDTKLCQNKILTKSGIFSFIE